MHSIRIRLQIYITSSILKSIFNYISLYTHFNSRSHRIDPLKSLEKNSPWNLFKKKKLGLARTPTFGRRKHMKIWGTLFYTKYRFGERGVWIGRNYSCCNLGFENGSRSFRFYRRYRERKKANETGTRASFERDGYGLNLREQSELIKLYSKRILDLGMHKVPLPFPRLSRLASPQRSATKECLGIRAQTTN